MNPQFLSSGNENIFSITINESSASNSEIEPKSETPDDILFLTPSNPGSIGFVDAKSAEDTPIIFAGPDDDFGALLAEQDFPNSFDDLQNVHRNTLTDYSKDILDLQGDNFSNQVKYKMVEGKSVKFWCCNICKKEFAHQYTLMRHLPTHTNERRFNCPTCGKAFRQMSTLSQHRAIHSEERPYSCEICQKTFNRISTLISHRKTHNEQKPHMCHVCNKSFHQKGNLRNHIFTHTNERPYKCDMCQKGFNQMSNLMCHKLKSHQHDEIPRYRCKMCSQTFVKRIALRHHEEQHYKKRNSIAEHANNISTSKVLVIDPIDTDEMRVAGLNNQTPFAILKPLVGTPILVRILPTGNKHVLIPATTDDIKNCGHISMSSKEGTFDAENLTGQGFDADEDLDKIEIKIPIVARVTSKRGPNGLYVSITSPNQSSEQMGRENGCQIKTKSSCIYNSPWASSGSSQETLFHLIGMKAKTTRNISEVNSLLDKPEVEFSVPEEHMIAEEEFNDFNMISIANSFNNSGMDLTSSHDAQAQNQKEISLNGDSEDSSQLTFSWNF